MIIVESRSAMCFDEKGRLCLRVLSYFSLAISMASVCGTDVYSDFTSRLNGYVNCFFLLSDMSFMLLRSSRLFDRLAGRELRRGLSMRLNSQEILCVGPLLLEMMGRMCKVGPVLCVLIKYGRR